MERELKNSMDQIKQLEVKTKAKYQMMDEVWFLCPKNNIMETILKYWNKPWLVPIDPDNEKYMLEVRLVISTLFFSYHAHVGCSEVGYNIILAYMAGRFVFSISKNTQCESCHQVIHSNHLNPWPHHSLILLKSNERLRWIIGLVIPGGTCVVSLDRSVCFFAETTQ